MYKFKKMNSRDLSNIIVLLFFCYRRVETNVAEAGVKS